MMEICEDYARTMNKLIFLNFLENYDSLSQDLKETYSNILPKFLLNPNISHSIASSPFFK